MSKVQRSGRRKGSRRSKRLAVLAALLLLLMILLNLFMKDPAGIIPFFTGGEDEDPGGGVQLALKASSSSSGSSEREMSLSEIFELESARLTTDAARDELNDVQSIVLDLVEEERFYAASLFLGRASESATPVRWPKIRAGLSAALATWLEEVDVEGERALVHENDDLASEILVRLVLAGEPDSLHAAARMAGSLSTGAWSALKLRETWWRSWSGFLAEPARGERDLVADLATLCLFCEDGATRQLALYLPRDLERIAWGVRHVIASLRENGVEVPAGDGVEGETFRMRLVDDQLVVSAPGREDTPFPDGVLEGQRLRQVGAHLFGVMGYGPEIESFALSVLAASCGYPRLAVSALELGAVSDPASVTQRTRRNFVEALVR